MPDSGNTENEVPANGAQGSSQFIQFEEARPKDEETLQRQQDLYMNLKKKLMKVYK